MTDVARVRPGGRTARTGAAVLAAATAELAEKGYDGLTVDAIAARAGVNRATVYRRWGGLDGLVLDAVERFAAAHVADPDTGRIDDDLRLWARSIVATLTDPATAPVVHAVFRAGGDSAAARAARRRFWLTRLVAVTPFVERAVTRGQLPAGTDAVEVVRHVGAPLYYTLFLLGEPVTVEAADLAAAATLAAARAGVFVPARAAVEASPPQG
jgi:AcrR family transcriptional regulator